MQEKARRRLRSELSRRHSLRMHMTALIAAALGIGFLANRALLELSVRSMPLRYAAAAAVAYTAFIGLIHLWITFVARLPSEQPKERLPDVEEEPEPSPPRSKGRWLDAADLLDFDFDGGGFIVAVAVVVALLLAGSTVYVIYEAPIILTEVAFEAFVAAGMIRTTSKVARSGWTMSLLRATAKPFAFTVIALVGVGLLVQRLCPTAGRVADLLTGCF